jgi:hypothetical protein
MCNIYHNIYILCKEMLLYYIVHLLVVITTTTTTHIFISRFQGQVLREQRNLRAFLSIYMLIMILDKLICLQISIHI